MWKRPALAIGKTLVLCMAGLAGAEPQLADEPDEPPEYMWGPKGIFIWVEVPAEVLEGKLFTMNVSMENRRTDEPFEIEELCIESSYFVGFQVTRARPIPEDAYEDGEELCLAYEMTIPAGARQEFNLQLRALEVGVYMGEVDLWEANDGDYSSRTAQTEVIDANWPLTSRDDEPTDEP